MIIIIDNQTDEVLDEINVDDEILVGEHTQDAESKEETLDFTYRGHYEGIKARNRLLIKDDDNQYREFVIENIEQTDDEINVFSNASYLEDLNNAKPIEPNGKNGLTTGEWIDYALTGTDWESGDVEFNGIRTINWTGYNNPYELLTIIANRFDMTLRFRIETDGEKVTSRYVDLVEINHLFNGKEIVRGKDLVEFKRSVNTEEVATALIALGPQPEEGKNRLVEIIIDDEANDKFNKRGKYNWKIYEPESEDENMTSARLRSLATTELNKRKEPVIDYSIQAINLEHLYGHEKVRLYDKVRIKDEELNRYAEANTKRITRNLLDNTDREFVFGDIVEYQRETLRAYFNSIINELKQRLENMPNTIDNIIEIVTDSELFERKISKSEIPPENPKDGDFWLDTSDSEVGVLYRWENGEWIKSSVTQAEEIGAVTREAAMYDNIKNTLELLTMLHSDLMSEYYSVMDNEYFIDNALKSSLTSAYNTADGNFNAVLTKFDSMTIDTATMGRLMETLELITNYRESLNTARIRLVAARDEIERYFALLQSQYSEEKYNEILNEVADKFGLEVFDGKLIGDAIFIENMNAIKEDLQKQLDDAKKSLESLEVGARNYQRNITEKYSISPAHNIVEVKSEKSLLITYAVEQASTPYIFLRDIEPLNTDEEYTINFYATLLNPVEEYERMNIIHGIRGVYSDQNVILRSNERKRITLTFTPNSESGKMIIFPRGYNETDKPVFLIEDVMLTKGNMVVDYEHAPEDMDNKITNINQSITNIEGKLESTVNRETFDVLDETVTKQGTLLSQTADELKSKADSSRVDTINNTVTEQGTLINQTAEELKLKANQKDLDTLNNTVSEQGTEITANAQEIALRARESDLNTVTGRVDKAEADIEVNAREISSRVKDLDYQTDKEGIVNRLSGAESSLTQQSKLIESKVGSTELTQAVNDAEKSAKDYADSEIDNIEIGGRNLLEGSADINRSWETEVSSYNYLLRPQIQSIVPKVKVGDTLTFSLDIEAEARTPIRIYDSNGNPSMTFGSHSFIVEEGIHRISFTATLKESSLNGSVWIMDVYNNNNGVKFSISKIKIEKGNKATDWTPAPEDIDAKIEENENRIIKHDTKFEQTDQQIALRATMTDVNQSDETLSRAISELVVNSTNGLKFNYDSNGRLASYSVGPDGIQFEGSKIRFKAQDSIMLQIADAQKAGNDAKAQADAARNGNNIVASLNLSGTTAKIEGSKIRFNASDSIMLQINDAKKAGTDAQKTGNDAHDKIDNLDVGSENLLPDSGWHKEPSGLYFIPENWSNAVAGIVWSSRQSSHWLLARVNHSNDGTRGASTAHYYGLRSPQILEPLIAGEEYTFTFKTRHVQGNNMNYRYTYIIYDNSSNQAIRPVFVKNADNGGQLWSVTFTANHSDTGHILIGHSIPSGSTNAFYLKEPMLYKGNAISSWSDSIQNKTDKDKIVSSINLDETGAQITGRKISLSGTAEFNSAFGNNRGITAISGGRIETDSMRAKKVEILRDDGVLSVDNGKIRAEYGINSASPEFMSRNPTQNMGGHHFWQQGVWWTTNRSIQSIGTGIYGGRLNYFEFLHTSRYLRVALVMNVENTGFVARIRNTAGTINEATSLARRSSESDSSYNVTRVLTADLGTPTYKRMNFYLYFMPNSQGGGADWAHVRIFHTMLTDEREIPGWHGSEDA